MSKETQVQRHIMRKAHTIIAAMLLLPLAALADDTALFMLANFTNTRRTAQAAQLYATGSGERGPVIDLTSQQLRRGTAKWNLSSIAYFTFEKQAVSSGIEEVGAGGNASAGPAAKNKNAVYTIDGRLVTTTATDPAALPKGIYIVNGKKIVVLK